MWPCVQRYCTQEHAFFDGLDVESLYQASAPAMTRGTAEPNPEAKWGRRQMSMMLTPMPQEYVPRHPANPIPTHGGRLEFLDACRESMGAWVWLAHSDRSSCRCTSVTLCSADMCSLEQRLPTRSFVRRNAKRTIHSCQAAWVLSATSRRPSTLHEQLVGWTADESVHPIHLAQSKKTGR